MTTYPKQADDLDVSDADDGLLVFVPSTRRVHHLNATASIVFELSNGQNSVESIANVVGQVFHLPTSPMTEIVDVIRQLLHEQVLVWTFQPPDAPATAAPVVLVLTPVKDAAPHAAAFGERLAALTYPAASLRLGLLASDSADATLEAFSEVAKSCQTLGWRSAKIWSRDFGYRLPTDMPRWEPAVQPDRRRVLALSRNHLLFNALADDVDWVLWLDADVVEFPNDIIELLLSFDRDIIQPNCVLDFGGPSFDLNAWRDKGRLHLHDLRSEGFFAALDAVGATMLFVRADRHRDGLLFPAFRYGLASPLARTDRGEREAGEVETEGLGMMAHDMGLTCWGLPFLEVRHHRG